MQRNGCITNVCLNSHPLTTPASFNLNKLPPPRPASWQYLRIYSPGGTVPACWLFKTSAISWPLTFWPWKWCPSHVWRGLPLCQF